MGPPGLGGVSRREFVKGIAISAGFDAAARRGHISALAGMRTLTERGVAPRFRKTGFRLDGTDRLPTSQGATLWGRGSNRDLRYSQLEVHLGEGRLGSGRGSDVDVDEAR